MTATPTCYRHLAEPATATCIGCLNAICRVCLTFDGASELCPPCAAKQRRSRSVRQVAIIAGVVLLAGGAGVWALNSRQGTRPSQSNTATAVPSFDHGEYTGEVKQQRERLAVEPCDRNVIIKHGETLMRAGDSRGALTAAEAFFARCGDYPRLLWVTYGAHRNLSEFGAAAADATRLIESSPGDKDYWVWRGMAFEAKGDLEKAAADYRQAITLQPALMSIPLNLVDVLERQKKPCDAMLALEQYLHQYPDLRREAQLTQRLLTLAETGRCEALAGKGKAVLRIKPGAGAIFGTVTVNQRVKGRFVIDTGATFVTISSKFASKVGLDAATGSRILVQTAGGLQAAQLVMADQVDLQGAKASRVEVAIAENLPEEIDGLLGLSFLSRFDLRLNNRAGKLEITAHE